MRVAFWLGAALSLLWAPAARPRPGDFLLHTFDRWDSLWFDRIVAHGYSTKQAAAFFPVYPMLVRAVAWVVRDHVAAGVLVSLAAGAGCAVLLGRIARRRLPAAGVRTAVVLLALYPFAFVFTAVYSDGLFLLFVLAAFDFAECGSALGAGVAAAFAVDTRLLGLALLPALAALLRPRQWWALLPAPAALAGWMAYLHAHFGDWLAYSHAERAGWQRQMPSPHAWWHELRTLESEVSNVLVHLPRPGPHGYPPYVHLAIAGVVDLACLVAAAALSWLAWRRLGPAFALYSFATLAIVVAAPAADQPLVSLPRFLLADFPLFLVLAALVEDRPRARTVLVCSFAALGAVAAVGFAHGAGIT